MAAGAWGQRSGGPGNPQQLNRYSYVLNNPVRGTDPSGHCGGITDMPGDCPGENKDAWVAGGRAIGGGGSSSGGGGSWTGQVAAIFLKETLKELGAAAMRNPVIRGAIAGGVGNGISAAILEGPTAASPDQLQTRVTNSTVAGATGGIASVLGGPLAGITVTAVTNSALNGFSPRVFSESALGETYASLPIGLVSGSLPIPAENGCRGKHAWIWPFRRDEMAFSRNWW